MPITEHPCMGTILICDFDSSFKKPEMVKRRPVIVISPPIAARHGLCTVVALSTTAPIPVLRYHREIALPRKLPPPWESDLMWIKGDMVYAVGFHRLNFVRLGKDVKGKRRYMPDPLTHEQIKLTRICVLNSMGLSLLTKHL